MTTTTEIIDAIKAGDVDEDLVTIERACSERTKARMKVGTKVRFASMVRPKYLVGTRATIVSAPGTGFIIEIDEADRTPQLRRFMDLNNQMHKVKPELLEVVE